MTARRRGIKPNAWTDAENALMRQHYQTGGTEALLPMLPRRSRKAINERALVLGLTRSTAWTPEQDRLLLMRYAAVGAAAVGELVGRTELAVRYRAAVLGVKGDKRRAKPRKAKKPAWSTTPVPRIAQRKAAPTVQIKPAWLAGEPIITSETRVTIAAPFVDRRFATSGPVARVVDSAQCRDWARAAA